jgi:hypothetical protein
MKGLRGMNQFVGRCLWWVGLIFCVFSRSLPAQTLGVGALATGFQTAAPEGQQSGGETTSQQTPNTTSAPPSGTNPQADQTVQKPSDQDLAPLPKRSFGTIPDLENVGIPASPLPLTVREKYIFSLHESFDVSSHVVNAFQAGLQQAFNSQPHYGEGWNAYGKRFLASEGDQITGSILIYGVLPAVLHEDPRYFRRGRGSAISRLWYAANRTFVTRRDDGANGFNHSEIFGQLISCGISTSYYPAQDRTVGRVASNWAVNLGGNSLYNMFLEYYPDFKHALFHRHAKPAVGN